MKNKYTELREALLAPYPPESLDLATWTDIRLLLSDLDKANEGWISVEDRLPKNNSYVICAVDGEAGQCYHYEGKFVNRDGYNDEPTHWMPLPPTDAIC